MRIGRVYYAHKTVLPHCDSHICSNYANFNDVLITRSFAIGQTLVILAASGESQRNKHVVLNHEFFMEYLWASMA